jgi:Enoyl-(Acyl carrier protein) reductase
MHVLTLALLYAAAICCCSVAMYAHTGIGRAVALAFAREGADVLISYLPEEQVDADETVRIVEDAGRKAVTVPGKKLLKISSAPFSPRVHII